MLIEPIQGEGGFIVPAPGFLPEVERWCREHGVLLVADEIQTGFCRTGDWFACQAEGVVPDLITTAKALAGGMPLAAVTGRADLMDAVHVGGLGGTYGGNPVACAAALAAIDTLGQLDGNAAARRIGERVLGALRAAQDRHPAIGDVRGRGAMLAVELVRPGTLEPDPDGRPADRRTAATGRGSSSSPAAASATSSACCRPLPSATICSTMAWGSWSRPSTPSWAEPSGPAEGAPARHDPEPTTLTPTRQEAP